MHRDVRHQVKSTYYDHNIKTVAEFAGVRGKAYFVLIEDNKGWKRLRIADGIMEVVEDFRRS